MPVALIGNHPWDSPTDHTPQVISVAQLHNITTSQNGLMAFPALGTIRRVHQRHIDRGLLRGLLGVGSYTGSVSWANVTVSAAIEHHLSRGRLVSWWSATIAVGPGRKVRICFANVRSSLDFRGDSNRQRELDQRDRLRRNISFTSTASGRVGVLGVGSYNVSRTDVAVSAQSSIVMSTAGAAAGTRRREQCGDTRLSEDPQFEQCRRLGRFRQTSEFVRRRQGPRCAGVEADAISRPVGGTRITCRRRERRQHERGRTVASP